MKQWVFLHMSQEIAKKVDPDAPARGVTDLRFRPFGLPSDEEYRMDVSGTSCTLDVNKWYGSDKLFDKLHGYWERNEDNVQETARWYAANADEYVYSINGWLAILDHFGPAADYDKSFVQLIEPVIGDILIFAYRDESSKASIKPRNFHGSVYTRRAFIDLFDVFLTRYNL